MHELSIAQSIIDTVIDQIKDVDHKKVTSIKIKVGELSAVDSGSLEFSYSIIVEGTEFQDTKLIIEEIPLTGYCETCNKASKLENYYFICGHCNSTNIKMVSGDELNISEIEYD